MGEEDTFKFVQNTIAVYKRKFKITDLLYNNNRDF